ncbi:50S ribosomal protein L30 [Candidatus Woesearchaeota archaeon CG_4_10_14_0_2_um_filter_33_13]|nr:MAG: 50S ribosomal protein L30 [Candidatus Woesearchaeota archaeon CG_4_10_14_0_2_um_filter_33_13]
MAKKKEISEELKLLKEKVKDGKAILGTERVLKQLRLGNLDRIFLASNCPSEVKKDLTINAGLVGATLIDLELSNEELGVLCKKNFFITVLGIVKE